jgi:hypothetical protein
MTQMIYPNLNLKFKFGRIVLYGMKPRILEHLEMIWDGLYEIGLGKLEENAWLQLNQLRCNVPWPQPYAYLPNNP